MSIPRTAFSWLWGVGSILLAGGAAVAQRTWIVDRNGGPGVDCTDIQPCINSASPGDRIAVVAPGAYQAFALTTGLEVAAVDGVRVPGFTISNVPANQAVRVSGLRVDIVALCVTGPAIQISGCAGPVLLSRVVAPVSFGLSARCLSITSCGAVLVLDSQFSGGTPYNPWALCPYAAVSVLGSRVCFQRCTLVGSAGVHANGLGLIQSYPGYPALSVTGGATFLVETACRGGAGGNGDGCALAPAPGGTALVGGPGLLLGSVFVAGPGGTSTCGTAPDGGAINGSFRMTADCVVQGTTSGVTVIPSFPTIRSTGEAMLGGTWNLVLSGPPGTIHFTVIDVGHGHIPVPGIDGPFLLTTAFIPFLLVTVGGGGASNLPLAVPMDPALRGRFVFIQGVALQPGNPVPSLTPVGDAWLR